MTTFSDFELLPSLLKTLADKQMSQPTEIQRQAMPLLLNGKSVVGVSETGSGKTLAYALPLLHALKNLENDGQPVKESAKPRAIVVTPTRELGEQVAKVFKTFTHDTRLRVRAALGGAPLEQSRRNISGPFEILLATPGRIIQLMELKLLHLGDVRSIIFDEADQMLDAGFMRDTKILIGACQEKLQLGLFSATVSESVQELINALFSDAEVIRSTGSGKVVPTLVTTNLMVEDGKRWPLMEKVLAQPIKGGTLVFVNTREQCDKLGQELHEKGYKSAVYRGEMDKNERRANLKNFREGKINFLVSTDLAGRGLDIENVERVINFHLPKQLDNYIHRVGRTARAGRKGVVVNLITERDYPLMSELDSNFKIPKETRPDRLAGVQARSQIAQPKGKTSKFQKRPVRG